VRGAAAAAARAARDGPRCSNESRARASRAARLRALHADRLLQHERGRRALAQLLREREPRLRRRAHASATWAKRSRGFRPCSRLLVLLRRVLHDDALPLEDGAHPARAQPLQPLLRRAAARQRRPEAETLCNLSEAKRARAPAGCGWTGRPPRRLAAAAAASASRRGCASRTRCHLRGLQQGPELAPPPRRRRPSAARRRC
jgi:hypothetical protein